MEKVREPNKLAPGHRTTPKEFEEWAYPFRGYINDLAEGGEELLEWAERREGEGKESKSKSYSLFFNSST